MIRNNNLFFFALLFLIGCKETGKSEKEKITSFTENTQNVTMISLFANPTLYDGKKVRIQGFLNLGFESDAIYLHKEDRDVGILKNGIWLQFSNQKNQLQTTKFDNRYVILEGVFNSKANGHMGAYSGEIQMITRIDTLR
jgi:hypothetical protein